MNAGFNTRKLERIFNSEKSLRKQYGLPMAKAIMRRTAILKNAPNLSCVPANPPMHLHQLTGNRKGQFAVDLSQPHRLVFEPNHQPIPTTDDEGLDKNRVTSITILEVVDYHPNT